jgi:hypothetical protein
MCFSFQGKLPLGVVDVRLASFLPAGKQIYEPRLRYHYCFNITNKFCVKFCSKGFNIAAQRPASPAAHSMPQARRLTDEINANRGRVHAVVMRAFDCGIILQNGACHEHRTSLIINSEEIMKLLKKQIKIERPNREKVNREQALKRIKELPKRKEKIIAAIREDTH